MHTLAFIDAANLFYGGLKSLGWENIAKYQAEALHYFAGVD